MKDKNGKELFVNDCVIFESLIFGTCLGRVIKLCPSYYESDEGRPVAYLSVPGEQATWATWDRYTDTIIGLSEDERILWLLENR